MLKSVNDSLAEAAELGRLLRGLPALVNLIPVRSSWPRARTHIVPCVPARTAHLADDDVTVPQFNPWPGSNLECSDEATIVAFANVLGNIDGLKCTVRWPRGTGSRPDRPRLMRVPNGAGGEDGPGNRRAGKDILAACGQLASKPPMQQAA